MIDSAWTEAMPREQSGRVGVFVEDGIPFRRADHVDAYEIRMGSQETLNAGYLGVIMVAPERAADAGHLVKVARMQMAMQTLADLGVRVSMMGAFIRLEVPK